MRNILSFKEFIALSEDERSSLVKSKSGKKTKKSIKKGLSGNEPAILNVASETGDTGTVGGYNTIEF